MTRGGPAQSGAFVSPASSRGWWDHAFGAAYRTVYANRTDAAAAAEIDHRLHLHWNRTTLVRHRRDGHLAEVRGVLVGVDETLTLLCDDGIEELPLDSVVAVEDPAR